MTGATPIDPAARDAYLRNLPAPTWGAMQRIYRWAESSTELRDKIAVDELFTFIAELRQQVAHHETDCPPREDDGAGDRS